MDPFRGFRGRSPLNIPPASGLTLIGWWSWWGPVWQALATIDSSSGEARLSAMGSAYGGLTLTQPTDSLRPRFHDSTQKDWLLPHRETGRASNVYTTDASIVGLANAAAHNLTVIGVAHATGANYSVFGWLGSGHEDVPLRNVSGSLSSYRYNGTASTQTIGDESLMDGPVGFAVIRFNSGGTTAQATWINDTYLGTITHTALTLSGTQFRLGSNSLTTPDQTWCELAVFSGYPTEGSLPAMYSVLQPALRGMRAHWGV